MEMSCQKYARIFRNNFPVKNYNGEMASVEEFSRMYGLVDVQEKFHQYEPPRSVKGMDSTQYFDCVLTTIWRAES